MKKILFAVLAFVVAGCASVPVTGRSQLSLVSDGEMNAMAIQSYNSLISSAKVIKTGKDAELVKSVGAKIAKAAETFLRDNGLESELASYSWEFNLIESPEVNAFCMPGGKIAVYTGILPVTKNADGLAVVLGHEVAHAIAKHGAERASQQLLTQYGGSLISLVTAKKSAQTQQLIMLAYGAGTQVGVLLPYGRKHELEADKIGLILMASAGYNPNYAVTFWQQMSAATGGGLSSDIFATHPSDTKRISEIKAALPEALKYYKK
ncbi:M48 family metallopeptidase [Endomicrobium proavitum]|uniref:Peptidase M48 Ste24p n=1 Tax=Endomicrobium proavitum TaxID=1408281 RepID=A0A0G3WL97_9BACT|nr:M48 family metallopeptidase [Endomicrobium proavitum]AKL98637.1 Peptidase M48 Ste24p [Endomicrobium proavitum]